MKNFSLAGGLGLDLDGLKEALSKAAFEIGEAADIAKQSPLMATAKLYRVLARVRDCANMLKLSAVDCLILENTVISDIDSIIRAKKLDSEFSPMEVNFLKGIQQLLVEFIDNLK
ncbi:MAG: hypothetical protein FWC67_01510 [Defluviitaleaceae bacterium]|nr:hypothetical protein [Defluviitaleaceae bacterium]